MRSAADLTLPWRCTRSMRRVSASASPLERQVSAQLTVLATPKGGGERVTTEERRGRVGGASDVVGQERRRRRIVGLGAEVGGLPEQLGALFGACRVGRDAAQDRTAGGRGGED